MNIPKAFEEKDIKQSEAVVIFRNRNMVALLHKFSLKKAYGDLSVLNIFNQFKHFKRVSSLSKNEKFIAYQLFKNGFLVENEINYKEINSKLMKGRNLSIYFMFIYTTDRCNFNCKYCYIEKRFKKDHAFNNLTDTKMKNGVIFSYITPRNQRTIFLQQYSTVENHCLISKLP